MAELHVEPKKKSILPWIIIIVLIIAALIWWLVSRDNNNNGMNDNRTDTTAAQTIPSNHSSFDNVVEWNNAGKISSMKQELV